MIHRGVFTMTCGLLVLLAGVACSDSTGVNPPAALEAVNGQEQEAEVGGTLAQPLVVRVLDARGTALSGVQVAWTVESGHGSVSPGTSTTDAMGDARTEWTLGTVAGEQRVVATVEGAGSEHFTAIALPGAAASFEVVAGDGQEGEFGRALADPLVVRVMDVHGNTVPGALVTWAVVSGEGSVDPVSSTSDAQGEATTRWSLGVAAGEQQVIATMAGVESQGFAALAAPPADFNLSIQTLQLNQGSQALDGGVGGVAGRPGVLRIVVRASGPNLYRPDVLVQLHRGERGLIREVRVPAPRERVPTDPALFNETDTWNLELSAEDVVSDLSIVAVVDPDGDIPDNDRSDNRFPRGDGIASLDVQRLAPLRIVFLPIRLTDRGITGAITPENVDAFLQGTRQWIPSGQIVTVFRGEFSTDRDMTQSSGWSQLLNDLQAVRTADGATDEYYHGIVPTFPGIALGGIAYVPPDPGHAARSALSYDREPFATETVAHELGHNMGRRHAPCGDPAGPDPEFPYIGAGIGAPGYDIVSRQFRNPGGFQDYMSYCRPMWTSDYTYSGILEWRRQDPLAVGAGQASGTAVVGSVGARASTTGLLLWGMISSAGVTLNPAFALSAPPTLPDAHGPYRLRGLAADGREVFGLAFRGTGIAHSDDPEEAHFTFFVPLSAAEIEAVERIEVSGPRGRATRAARRPAAASPAAEARVVPDPAGRARLQWEAERYPMALVRDAATGRILSIATSGDVRLDVDGARPEQFDIILSDGVRSSRARAQ